MPGARCGSHTPERVTQRPLTDLARAIRSDPLEPGWMLPQPGGKAGGASIQRRLPAHTLRWWEHVAGTPCRVRRADQGVLRHLVDGPMLTARGRRSTPKGPPVA